MATKPVDFHRQADTLAALVQEALRENPYSGSIYVFRAKRTNRVKLLWWDVVGRHRHLSSHEASGKRPVSLACDRGRNDAAHAGAAYDAACGAGMAPHAAPRDRSSECDPMIVRHDDSSCGSMLQGGPESATTWLVFGNAARVMTDVSDILPDDVGALRAQLAAALAGHAAAVTERDAAVSERDAIRSERDQLAARNQRLESIIAEIRRAHFGRKSEKINDD